MIWPYWKRDRVNYHTRLDAKLMQRAIRARYAGYRRSPNKVGRWFTRIAPDMIEARLLGIDPIYFAGREGQRPIGGYGHD